jgi:hypothetical protein
MVQDEQTELCDELEKLKLEIIEQKQLNELKIKYDIEDLVRQAQKQCSEIQRLRQLMTDEKMTDYKINEQDTACLKDRICIPRMRRSEPRY